MNEITNQLLRLSPVKESPLLIQAPVDEFIVANTKQITIPVLKNECTIPAFAKDLESTIPHTDFIETVGEAVENFFQGEHVSLPAIRVSHPINGRIPEAKGKPAKLLREDEKTLYYERMAFVFNLPGIQEDIAGNKISLVMGGIRAYNQENLYGRKTEEKFKIFIGFKVHICMNLSISIEGTKLDVRARTIEELMTSTYDLLESYNIMDQVRHHKRLPETSITEKQFAQLLGRMRMYPFLDRQFKKDIPDVLLNDSQISQIVKEYYQDPNFGNPKGGSISLWNLFNLLTASNKSSYIDRFLQRSVSAGEFINHLRGSLGSPHNSWYLSGV